MRTSAVVTGKASLLKVEVSQSDLEYVQRRLKQHEADAPKALRDAANKTAVTARKLLREHAQKRYTVKTGSFNDKAKISPKATIASPVAVITFRGRPIRAVNFHHTVPKSGVKLEILRGEGLTQLENQYGHKAFIANGRYSGAKLILQRVKEKGRFPVRAPLSPSAAKMIEKVYDGRGVTDPGMKQEIHDTYQHYLDQQIERFLNQ